MILPIAFILAIALIIPRPPELTNPKDIAEWSKCDIDKVDWFVNQSLSYKEVSVWESSDLCFKRGYGDCKCFATAHKEIMDNCAGWTNKVVTVRRPNPDGGWYYHAITIFVNDKGRMGVFNNNSYKFLSEDDDISELINLIPGGKWEYVNG